MQGVYRASGYYATDGVPKGPWLHRSASSWKLGAEGLDGAPKVFYSRSTGLCVVFVAFFVGFEGIRA